MNDGQRSLARLLHPVSGPRLLLVVIKHTDWKARYLRVFMVRREQAIELTESVIELTESVADALDEEMFDPHMNRTDDDGFVLGHSASIMLPIRTGKEAPGVHIQRALVDRLDKLISGHRGQTTIMSTWPIHALKVKII